MDVHRDKAPLQSPRRPVMFVIINHTVVLVKHFSIKVISCDHIHEYKYLMGCIQFDQTFWYGCSKNIWGASIIRHPAVQLFNWTMLISKHAFQSEGKLKFMNAHTLYSQVSFTCKCIARACACACLCARVSVIYIYTGPRRKYTNMWQHCVRQLLVSRLCNDVMLLPWLLRHIESKH